MPYKNLGGKLDDKQSNHGWQIRISIDPSVLKKDDPKNKIKEIEDVLKKGLANYPADAKIWIIPNEQALYDGEYDVTTSTHGKDRDQRGKEVCIYLANTQHALSSGEYKTLLLTLWAELQRAGVPLMYMNIPGDKKIQGPADLPTPFSITSSTPKQEWFNKHGILYKKFAGWDREHPILQVQMTEKDLKTHKIQFNAIQIAKLNREYFKDHQAIALERLENDLTKIAAQKNHYQRILFDDDLIEHIKSNVRNYNSQIETSKTIEQKIDLNERFDKEINEDEALQCLLNCYPHQTNSEFSEHDNIITLRRLRCVKEEDIDGLIQQLRDDYEEKVNDIASDFFKHEQGDNEAPETMFIDWASYIPEYTDMGKQLIEKNPAQMQAVYRRVVLLELEKQAHEKFKKQWIKATYGNGIIYNLLTKFANEINCMEKDVENNQCEIAPDVLSNFQALYSKTEDEIFSQKKCQNEKTPYSFVIKHFTSLAKEIKSGKKLSVEKMTHSSQDLDDKLRYKTPISKVMRATICGLIGAIVGSVIGFGVGAAVTFWGGGLGSLPAAIAGGMMGITLMQGLTVGSAALGAGIASGTIGGFAGFFSGKQATYMREIDDTYLSLGVQRKK